MFWKELALAAVLVAGGCERVFDYGTEPSAEYRMRLVCDWNMLGTDAAAACLGATDVYIFDVAGNFVKTVSASRDQLVADGMVLPLDLAPGDYSYVATSGEDRSACYEIAAASSLSASTIAIRNPQAIKQLTPLYQAHGSFSLPETALVHEVEASFVNDFNDFKVVLQNLSGEPLDADDFIFTITDDNALLGADNVPVEGHEAVYGPFVTRSGSAAMGTEGSLNVAFAEFTLGRLYAGKAVRPVLTIQGRDGRAIIRLPLIDCLLLVKGYYNRSMSDQEYLDRQDDWSLTLFLQDGSWASTTLIINSWKVVNNSLDF